MATRPGTERADGRAADHERASAGDEAVFTEHAITEPEAFLAVTLRRIFFPTSFEVSA